MLFCETFDTYLDPVSALIPANPASVGAALCFKTRGFFHVISLDCYIEAVQNHFMYQTIFDREWGQKFTLQH